MVFRLKIFRRGGSLRGVRARVLVLGVSGSTGESVENRDSTRSSHHFKVLFPPPLCFDSVPFSRGIISCTLLLPVGLVYILKLLEPLIPSRLPFVCS